MKFFSTFIALICSVLNTALINGIPNEIPEPISNQKSKIDLVLALPFQPNIPLDPHWYTPDYISYIANLLPPEQYNVVGYFVSLENISQFLDDMEALYEQKKNVRILNFCDGGEWDGYPGISVVRKWEQHPISRLIPMSGADAQFIFNSDDKSKMNAYIRQASLKSLPQALLTSEMLDQLDKKYLTALLLQEHLDQTWPLFCKLNIGAGALGISAESICHNIEALMIQIHKQHMAFPNSDILIQPYLVGPEYTILVLKDQVYVAVQRDFHNPYNLMLENYLTDIKEAKDEIVYYPAPKHVQALALKAIQAIPGRHHYTRVDLRNDAHGNTYVLDINDRAGFGNPSTIKCMLEYHHLSEAQLLLDIIDTCSCIQNE